MMSRPKPPLQPSNHRTAMHLCHAACDLILNNPNQSQRYWKGNGRDVIFGNVIPEAVEPSFPSRSSVGPDRTLRQMYWLQHDMSVVDNQVASTYPREPFPIVVRSPRFLCVSAMSLDSLLQLRPRAICRKLEINPEFSPSHEHPKVDSIAHRLDSDKVYATMQIRSSESHVKVPTT
jgi:hypothetical protein